MRVCVICILFRNLQSWTPEQMVAQAPGVIKAVYAQPGDQVQAKTLLIDIELTSKES